LDYAGFEMSNVLGVVLISLLLGKFLALIVHLSLYICYLLGRLFYLIFRVLNLFLQNQLVFFFSQLPLSTLELIKIFLHYFNGCFTALFLYFQLSDPIFQTQLFINALIFE
jgi:hypothetical protein